MDINKLLSVARKNQSKASNEKKIGYSTAVTAPKKLKKNVNPDQIRAFLNRKKEIEKMQREKDEKKRHQLQKLREDKKHTKKAKAMATRTKDNLRIYHNNSSNRQGNEVVLSPEAEMKHKAFMNKLMASSKKCHSEGEEFENSRRKNVEKERSAVRKKEKTKGKAKRAAQLDFKDLLDLAKQQKADQTSSDDSSSDDEEVSSEEVNAEEKYERERRKRKKLEAELRELKRRKNGSAKEPSLKIAKLEKGLSEASKQAKVKALMENFERRKADKKSSTGETLNGKSKDSMTKFSNDKKMPNSEKITSVKKGERKLTNPGIKSDSKASSNNHGKHESKSTTNSHLNQSLDRRKKNGQTNNVAALKSKDKSSFSQLSKPNFSSKANAHKPKPTNPYAELMQKAKMNADKRCTLSVTSSTVRTNYPGVALTDPKKPKYENVKVPSKEMIEEYRRRKMLQQQGLPRRPIKVLRDEDSDDEYDSEMEGFIVDGDDEEEEEAPIDDISSEIGKIFGYDRSKYGRESEYELSKMDASYKDIEREEKRSLKIAKEEDAREAKLLLEEEARQRNRRKI